MNAAKQQLDAIFFTALNLPDDGQRKSFLERACAGDGPLLSAVEKLLAAHPATEDFFAGDSPVLRLTAADFQAAAEENILEECSNFDEKIGSRIGRYKLLQRLGEGGWGVVYVAEQEEPIRRRVALKIIKLGMDTKSVVARFQTECQALALMDHPAIARVLDAGATGAGRPYFVMELVSGVKITEFCYQNHLDLHERLALFVQICQAVQHAHQKGIIHRDLKPSNILVTLQDGVPAPKVIDFGIAKAIEERLTERTLITAHEPSVGTPAYMSPEQADASGLDIDTRSDIYSLGVLLYELLTGRTPFGPQEPMPSGLEAMRRVLKEQEPQRPSSMLGRLPEADLKAVANSHHVKPRQLVSRLKGDLDWVVMKAVAKDRNQRYESVNGLAMDLQRYLDNEPVLARPSTGFYRFQKLVRRNKVVFAAGTLVVMALVIGLGATTWLFVLERKARDEQARLRVEAESARASESRLRLQAEAMEKLTRATQLLSQAFFNGADALLAQTSLALVEPSPESVAVLRTLGEMYAVSGRWQQAADCFTTLMRLNRNSPAEVTASASDLLVTGPVLLECDDAAGYQLFRQEVLDRFAGCTVPLSAAHVLKVCLLAPADEKVFQRLKPLAEIVEQSLANPRLRANKDLWDWWAMTLGLMEYRHNHFTNAVALAQDCLKSDDSNSARLATAHSILAMSYRQLGQSEQALSELALARQMVETRFAKPLQLGRPLEGSWYAWVTARRLMLEARALIEDGFDPGEAEPGASQAQ